MAKAKSPRNGEYNPIGLLIFGIILVCFFIYQWIVANLNTIFLAFEIIFAIVVVCIIFYIIYYAKNYNKIQQEKEDKRINIEKTRINEEKRYQEIVRARQIEREKASRNAEETRRDIEKKYHDTVRAQQIECEEASQNETEFKATVFYQVVETIGKFQPTKKWGNEDSYHKELQGFLRAYFPKTKFEVQTGASRPDIIIENIAIEIKGPTDSQALVTLADKCLRYSYYYKNMIIVLFEPTFSEGRFSEFNRGMKQHFPHVKIIIK